MFRFTTSFMALALGLTTPISADAAGFCVAVNGGFGHGGYTYIAPDFTLPAKNHCEAWAGFAKTGVHRHPHTRTVRVAFPTAVAVLDLSIFSTDPDFFGVGPTQYAWDSNRDVSTGVTSCPFTSQDTSSTEHLRRRNCGRGDLHGQPTETSGQLMTRAESDHSGSSPRRRRGSGLVVTCAAAQACGNGDGC